MKTFKTLIIVLFGIVSAVPVFGQYTIDGEENALQNETHQYTLNGTDISNINWSLGNGATIGYTGNASVINSTFNNAGATLVSCTVYDEFNNMFRVKLPVNVAAVLEPGAISGAQTLCNGGDPSTLNSSSAPSGGSGSYVYQWQISSNNSDWSVISSSNVESYNPPGPLTSSKWYRRKVSSGAGAQSQIAYTASVKVTVNGPLNAGTISGFQVICYNEVPGTLSNSSSPYNGLDGYDYQWQISANNGPYQDITGATSASYTPTSGLTSSGTYRRRVASCNQIKYSNTVSVSVRAEIVAPNIEPSKTTNCGNTELTMGSAPAGVTWYWQSTADGEDDSSEAANSTITRTSGSVYYLRGKNDIDCWGPARTVSYTVITAPNIPDEPSITLNCDSTELSMGNAPAGVTWYWQSSDNDEDDSSAAAESSITRTSGTVYYLRAKNNAINCWGPTRTVTYSINGSSTWYADTDNDDFGDPSSSILNCGQPAGYVANSDDYDDNTANITNIAPQNFFYDGDSDGFGDPTNSVNYSVQPSGYVTDNTDQCPSQFGTENGCNPDDLNPLDQNYVYSRTYQVERSSPTDFFLEDQDLIQEITYYDGIGRPMQQIGISQSPNNKKDIITHIGYDEYGRMEKEWLPVYEPNEAMGSYRIADMELTTRSYYKNHQDYGDDFPTVSGLDVNAYSQKEFEPSPLNRVLKQAAPGEDWKLGNGHEIDFEYQSNEVDEVRKYNVTTSNAADENTFVPALVEDGYYLLAELAKTVTKDENHDSGNNHTTEEFTDKNGRVVLKRTYNANEPHDTYYIYNDFGNLTYVLPPKVDTSDGVSATELTELCYQYTYDHRNRLVEKQIPGKEKEYIVYNKLDQPIMTQDANLRTNGQWLFSKYDAFGRVAYTGIIYVQSSRESLQINANASSTQYEERITTPSNLDGEPVYYSNDAYPANSLSNANSVLHTVNYYDDYIDLPSGAPSSVTLLGSSPTETNTTKVQGLPTVSRVRVLEVSPAQWINTVSYYDDKGRAIYSYSENEYLNTIDIVASELDFVGRPQKVRASHTRNGNTIVTLDNFTYDHVGRLLTQTQCIGDATLGDTCPTDGGSTSAVADLEIANQTITTDKVATTSITLLPNTTISPTTTLSIDPNASISAGDEELIVSNTYDELGQLESKQVGGAADGAGLQTVNYEYNVRGWLQAINDNAPTDNALTLNSDDLWGFRIKYNDVTDPTKQLFNGNISETLWDSKSENSGIPNVSAKYTYTYDPLNRITAATDNTGKFNVSGVTYDKNGNIQKLKREGWTSASPSLANNTGFGTMDDLTYSYDSGNKLMKVADAAAIDQYGFKDDAVNTAADSSDDYVYDPNGNMTRDNNKGITGITYNHLNLPEQVTFNTGNIQYVYSADGAKLKKTVSTTGTETLYANGYLYEGNTLQFFPHPEGYVSAENGNYKYVYNYLDHLGNVRLSYTDENNDGDIAQNEIVKETNYYPYGLSHRGYNNNVSPLGNSVAKKYMFGGKEYQDELDLGWYDVSARNYDPALGRWMNLDPLAEQMRRHSPYNFGFDNPIYFQDYDGMMPCPPGQNCPSKWEIFKMEFKETAKSMGNGVKQAFKDLNDALGPPINVEGSDSGSNGQGGMMLSNDEGGSSGDQSLIRESNSESGDVPWLEVGDAVAAGKGMAGAGGSKGNKKGDGMTDATRKTKNTASTMKSKMKNIKKGMSHGKKVVKYGESAASSLSTANSQEPDTLTYKVEGFSTKDPEMRGFMNEDPVGSKNVDEAVELMLSGDEIDSITVKKKFQ